MTTALATTPESQSVALIREAMANGADPQYLRELLSVRREWEADEARKAYFIAISEFQSRAPIIEKADDAHGKKYAAMDRIWRTIRPLFTELGLSCTWQVCELREGVCHVEGQLAHSQGHSVPLVMDVALPELIRGQNLAQQVGSARTYATRYAFCAAVGLQTGEDDDGSSAGTGTVSAVDCAEISALLDKFGTERDTVLTDMLEWAGAESLELIPADKVESAKKALNNKLKQP